MADDQINVKVTATTDAFDADLKKSVIEVEQFSKSLNDAAEKAQKLNPAAFKAVAEELNAGKISATGFAKSLEDIQDGADRATIATRSVGLVAKEAAGETEKLAFGSAGVTRELVVLGREAASGNFNRLPGSISVLLSRMNLLSPSLFVGAAAVAGIGYALYESAAQAERFDEQMSGIQAKLEALGQGSSFDPTLITALVDQLRLLPGVNAEAASSIVEGFTTAGNMGGAMVAKLTSLVGDFAIATGQDAIKAADELAKAFDDPVKSGQRLADTLELFSPAEQQAFDRAKALNNVTQEQAILIGALSDRITGLREKSLTPMQQADELLSQSVVDLSGHVGSSDTLWQRMGKSIQQDTIFLKDFAATAIEAGGHLGEIFDSKLYTSGRLPKVGDAPKEPATKTGGTGGPKKQFQSPLSTPRLPIEKSNSS